MMHRNLGRHTVETLALPRFLCCIILTLPTRHLYLEKAGICGV